MRTLHSNNFRQIAAAIEQYASAYGAYPPAYVADERGRRMHSWRVLILPYLGWENAYDFYRLDEPWDSDHNLQLVAHSPEQYHCSSLGAALGDTTVHAIEGAATMWPGRNSLLPTEIADSTSTVLLLADCERKPTPWTSPVGLSLEEASEHLSAPAAYPHGYWSRGFFTSVFRGRLFSNADGGIYFRELSQREIIERATIDDGRPVVLDWPIETGETRVHHYGNWSRLAFFVAIVAAPLSRLRRRLRAANQRKPPPLGELRKIGRQSFDEFVDNTL